MPTSSFSPFPERHQPVSGTPQGTPDGRDPRPGRGAEASTRRKDPRHVLGRLGEQLAARHLERLDFALLERNARTRFGEIDLIAFDGRTMVFAEVKTRRLAGNPRTRKAPSEQPLAGLRPRQRARLRRLAAAWLYDEARIRPSAHTIRFDAIGVTVDARDNLVCLDHIEGAW